MFDKLDFTYQTAFAASEKPSPPAEWGPLRPSTPPATYTSTLKTPLKNIISKLTVSKPSTSSPVKRAEYISPYKAKYWAVKTKLLRKQMEGTNEDFILEAIFKLRTENTEVHDKIIDYFINQYDEYSQSSEDDVLEEVKPPVEWDTQRPSTPPATYTSTLTTPLKNMISKLTGSKPSTSSPVTRAEYISPYKAKY